MVSNIKKYTQKCSFLSPIFAQKKIARVLMMIKVKMKEQLKTRLYLSFIIFSTSFLFFFFLSEIKKP